MASSTSRRRLLLLLHPSINQLQCSSLVARSFRTTTSLNTFNGDACKSIGIFSKLGLPSVAARLFHTTPAMEPNESKSSDHLRDMFQSLNEKNSYLMAGPKKFCNIVEDENALYTRLDMSGVIKKDWSCELRMRHWILGDECASRAKYQLEEHTIYSTNIVVPSEMYRMLK